ncbi:hypothetical protein P9209_22570 [Prescottella defluvii]|nr:hypothetical protein P9209_22570 [Prescottella defluvii]
MNHYQRAETLRTAYRDRVHEILAATEPTHAIGATVNRLAEGMTNQRRLHERWRDLARVWVETSRELATLRDDLTRERQDLRSRTERQLYGLAAGPNQLERQRHFMSAQKIVRDTLRGLNYADHETVQTARDELQALYTDATLSDDTILARAVARAAINHGWNNILEQHLAQHPGDKAHLDTLTALDRADDPTDFRDASAFNLIPPNELTGGQARIEIAAETGINTTSPGGIEALATM